LLHAFKRSSDINAGRILARMFEEAALTSASQSMQSIICPLPSHRLRRFIRGFVPTYFLAHELTKKGQLQCNTHWLRQPHYRKQQKEKNRVERLATTLPYRWHGPTTGEYHIVLLDDLITTGTTIEQAAAVIPSNFTVDAWAIARTSQQRN